MSATVRSLSLTVLSMMSFSLYAASPDLVFNGISQAVFSETPSAASGLNKVYVLADINNVHASFIFDGDSQLQIRRFGSQGAVYSETIEDIIVEDNKVTFPVSSDDMGYELSYDGRTYYIWIINYSLHPFNISTLGVSSDSDCDYTKLIFEGSASPIYYYGINGRRYTLSRGISMEYNNEIWSEDKLNFTIENVSDLFDYIDSEIFITPPVLVSTDFKLSGDRFMEYWGKQSSVTSDIYTPVAVDVRADATQSTADDENNNQIVSSNNDLGGNAPCDILFSAFTSEAVIHDEWQISDDVDFSNILYRINDKSFEHTFTQSGKYYVRFMGSNSDGSCEAFSETFSIDIGESKLLVPNVFSPNDDGVNDQWKISYSSLIDFECWIFDRHGKEVFHFSDPSAGWDGKLNGKPVKSGVYYYVIKALGSDGRKYNLSGDINIIGYRKRVSDNDTTL